MFRFDNYLEQWAEIYRPIQHSPSGKNKRFFRLDSIKSAEDFAISLPTNGSPSVGFVTHQDIDVKEAFFYPVYRIFFYVKSEDMKDAIANAQAKYDGVEHAMKLLAYLREQKYEENSTDLENVDVDNATILTTGPLYNGWYATEIILSDLQKMTICVDESDYIV